MTVYGPFRVSGIEGLQGTVMLTAASLDESETAVLRLQDGREFVVPSGSLTELSNNSYQLRLSAGELEQYRSNSSRTAAPEAMVLPIIVEELYVGKRVVETARLRIGKKVGETVKTIDQPLFKNGYEIKRVSVNRAVEGPVEARREGDTLILPVLEEVLVIEKRLILREEVHITPKREESRQPRQVTLRTEEVQVERVDTKLA